MGTAANREQILTLRYVTSLNNNFFRNFVCFFLRLSYDSISGLQHFYGNRKFSLFSTFSGKGRLAQSAEHINCQS